MTDPATAVTFGLAFLGYLGLCAAAVGQVLGRASRRLIMITAAVVLGHVLLVWQVRYGWSVAAARAAGLAPVIVFHVALVLIVAAALAPGRWSKPLILLAFPVVTVGALGAVFGRQIVADYRWPVISVAGATVVVIAIRVAVATAARRGRLTRQPWPPVPR
ncbi:hypothetical protein LQ327_30025 [Actinomycetospora endophytica]|uniref:Integral membrane protein n=1 Tax=Actinomycetospora endophytica TaxID=2291215 RepID=A0ABS8PI59_9PSEU|nr:hypothetical protein [Actinomycetospora endophytica]MCD2197617.1 hypothetical protein [Actinomycetospora endophytica]